MWAHRALKSTVAGCKFNVQTVGPSPDRNSSDLDAPKRLVNDGCTRLRLLNTRAHTLSGPLRLHPLLARMVDEQEQPTLRAVPPV